MRRLLWPVALLVMNVMFFVLNAYYANLWAAGLSAFAAGLLAGTLADRLGYRCNLPDDKR